MSTAELETRLKTLESEMALLKTHITRNVAPATVWWDAIAGTFKGDAAHEEAMRLGREYRQSQNTVEVDADNQ